MEMGGRLQDFFSLVVAISSTADTSECSVAPVNFLIFHTRACFLLSYFALPARDGELSNTVRYAFVPLVMTDTSRADTSKCCIAHMTSGSSSSCFLLSYFALHAGKNVHKTRLPESKQRAALLRLLLTLTLPGLRLRLHADVKHTSNLSSQA